MLRLWSLFILDLTCVQYPVETILFVHPAVPFGGSLYAVSSVLFTRFFSGFLRWVWHCLHRWSSSSPRSWLPSLGAERRDSPSKQHCYMRRQLLIMNPQHEPHYQLVDFIHSGNRWHHVVRLSELFRFSSLTWTWVNQPRNNCIVDLR